MKKYLIRLGLAAIVAASSAAGVARAWVGQAGSVTPPFALSDLGAALVADWNAEDHGTARMTDDGAGLISMWQDGVLGMQLTGTTTARPTWGATSFNSSKPCVQFDGTANVLAAANTTGLPTGSTDFSIWVVVNSITPAAVQQIWTHGGTTNGTIAQIQNTTTSRINASNGTTIATSLVQSAGNHVFGGIFGASTISGQLDGTIGATTAYTLNTGTTRTRMGANNNATPTNFWGGCINRLLIVSPAQTDDVNAKIAGYLAWNAGIQSVLTNAYKNYPP